MRHQAEQQSVWQPLVERLFADEIRAWRGQARLSTAFWLYGVLPAAVLILLYTTTVYMHQLLAQQALLIGFGLCTVLSLVSIWRCSLATASVWGMFARYLTVAWAANVALVLLFRQLELLAVFLQPVAAHLG